jgi:hypothetical protein
MFFPNEIILLFFFRLADVFPNEIILLFFLMLSLGKNISEPKEEQQSDLFGEKHQRA